LAVARKKSRLEDARARMYHDLLFESAEAIFGAKGYGGATMQDIAAEAGVSLKTLYATYPSKQELYDEVMRVRAAEFLEQTGEAMAGVEDPLERVRQGIIAYVGFLLEHEDWLKIHLRDRIAWSMEPKGQDAAAAWSEGLDDYAKVIADGQQQRVFCDGDPLELAVLTQAVMQVQMARAIDQRQRDPAAVVDSILTHVWRLLGVEQ
jgi:AcrR family transcriptional regulator